jgi:alcohol dehydrogenase YqhD (iron-dependent ADH family)
MNNFELYTPTKLIFGDDVVSSIGEKLSSFKTVLIHYGSERVVQNGLIKKITDSLDQYGIKYILLGGVVPNPVIDLVREGVTIAKENKINLVLAVGGGSVLDSAKAIAVGYFYKGDTWKIYTKVAKVKKALPIATVLTIPAAGSEMSNSSVISNLEVNLKLGINSDLIRPLVSFVDPSYFMTLPYVQFQAGVSDMLSHIFERFFSPTDNIEFTSRLAAATIKSIINASKQVVDDYKNLDAWKQIGFASSIAHNGVLGCGRVQDWACHRISHYLTSNFGSTHGIALSVLTYNWIQLVNERNPEQLASLLKILLEGTGFDTCCFEESFKFFTDYYDYLKLPKTLKEIGITDDKLFKQISKSLIKANDGKPLGGIIKLFESDILLLLQRSL